MFATLMVVSGFLLLHQRSIEIFSRVLHRYSFPRNTVLDMVEKNRSNSYPALRSAEKASFR